MKWIYPILFCLLVPPQFSDSMESYRQIFERMNRKVEGETAAKPDAISPKAEPAKKLQAATIEPVLVFLFHPLMQDYHFGVNSFARPLVRTGRQDPRILQKQRHDNYIKFQNENRQKQESLERLNQQLAQNRETLKYEQLLALDEATEKFKDNPNGLQSEIASIEERFWAQRREMEARFENSQKEYLNWKNQTVSDAWLPQSERDVRLNAIVKDIETELSALCQEEGILILLKATRKAKNLSSIPFKVENLPVAGLELNPLKTLLDGRFSFDHSDSEIRPAQVAQVRLDYLNQFDQFSSLLGGVVSDESYGLQKDLTHSLLKRLWQKHGFETAQVEKLSQSIVWLLREE